jgi:hypothetical protein
VDQTSGTNPPDAQAAQAPQDGPPAEPPAGGQPGFRTRGQARRRARFLRRARELAYRDLGGLVFNLHRFGQRNDALVLTKLGTLTHIDTELRAIETALDERHPVTVLREAGITACPRCAAIHGSEDRFCPNCGLPMSRHADLPVAGAPAGDPAPPPQQPMQQPAYSTPPPAYSGGQSPGAAPAASPPPRPQQPATAQHRASLGASLPGAGRAPVPPARAVPSSPSAPAEPSTSPPEQSTEILRPQTPGS